MGRIPWARGALRDGMTRRPSPSTDRFPAPALPKQSEGTSPVLTGRESGGCGSPPCTPMRSMEPVLECRSPAWMNSGLSVPVQSITDRLAEVRRRQVVDVHLCDGLAVPRASLP